MNAPAVEFTGHVFTPWTVSMSVQSARDAKPEAFTVEVPKAHSEASAIRLAFLRAFGGTGRKVHAIEMVRVVRRSGRQDREVTAATSPSPAASREVAFTTPRSARAEGEV